MAWKPQKIFFSHASADKTLTSIFKRLIEEEKILQYECKLYVADHALNGGHITETFRLEIYDSNALIVAWTKSANEKKTAEIISYEIGMAYALRLPIFIFIFDGVTIPWFFGDLTKYEKVSSQNEDDICKALKKIDIYSIINPITVNFPREEYKKHGGNNFSGNMDFIQENGSFELKKNWDGIFHYLIENHRPKTETNVWVKIFYPTGIKTDFDPGIPYEFGMDGTQRTDIFFPIKYPNGLILYFPSFPASHKLFEIRVKTNDNVINDFIRIFVTSDNIISWRSTEIPLKVTD